jgi:DNA-binding CsgD family transcriptional regulator
MTLPARDGHGWERFFWMTVERSCNPVSVLDAERRYVAVNAPHAEAVGRSRSELIGTRADERLPEKGSAKIDAGWRELMQDGERSNERIVLCADGGRMLVRYLIRWDSESELAVCVWERLSTKSSAPPPQLTAREREIVEMVASGMTSREIAGELQLSLETVRTHIRNAMAKTGTHTRAGLVAKALAKR